MRTQTCSTCKTVKPIDGEWDVTVFMCSDCVAAEKPEPTGADAEVFDKVDDLRLQLQSANAGRKFGTTYAARKRAARDFDRLTDKLGELLDSMTVDQLRGYRDHRVSVMDAAAARVGADR